MPAIAQDSIALEGYSPIRIAVSVTLSGNVVLRPVSKKLENSEATPVDSYRLFLLVSAVGIEPTTY
jgi:hypothetical protein